MGKTRSGADITQRVASVVLAGGQGVRLFPLTEQRCKPAVSFGGRYRLIDIPLSNSLNSSINRIFVISQYFASELQQHILATYRLDLFSTGKIDLLCPEETMDGKKWFKGTADAVRQNLHHILEAPVDYFLILSGDQLYNLNFKEMLSFAIKSDADLVIASLPVEEPEARRMGLLKIDSSSRITEFYEKPTDPEILRRFEHSGKGKTQFLGSMGIYIFKREALIAALKGEEEDFGKHIIPKEIGKKKTFAYLYNGYWEDIGTIESYYLANLALASHKTCLDTYDEHNPIYTCPHNLPSPLIKDTTIKNSLISQGSIIEAKEISNSVVGIRTQIKKGTVIRHSILIGNHHYTAPKHQHPPLPQQFAIGENCLIEKAIIDEHTSIGNNVQLVNKKGVQKWDGDGVYIRDGIIIVTRGTTLPDGYIL